MRLVYFGTSNFAVPVLRALIGSIILVVSQPDGPSGRGKKLRVSPVKAAAEEIGIRVLTPESARGPEFVEHVRSLEPDALVVASYGQILSEALLQSAKRGGINLHASILPRYRGAAPIHRVILDGETETGVTLMQMDKGMDTGEIIAIERLPIGPYETTGELEVRLSSLAAGMAAKWLPTIVSGDYPRNPQNDVWATLAPKMNRDDGLLKFQMSAEEAYRRFRACTPRPGSRIKTRFGVVKVLEARNAQGSGEPGEVLATGNNGVAIAFGAGALVFLRVQLEGKQSISAYAFANGRRLSPGSSLA
ncbi:MAG: methionyl-tRNA formyltransferase [Fimbriimonadales bacterium]